MLFTFVSGLKLWSPFLKRESEAEYSQKSFVRTSVTEIFYSPPLVEFSKGSPTQATTKSEQTQLRKEKFASRLGTN